MSHSTILRVGIVGLVVALLAVRSATVHSDTVYFAGTPPVVAQVPLYIEDAVPPLNMLVMGKDHKIYYEAYNDASDLDGDGILDVGYRGYDLKTDPPTDGSSRYKIDYYGYFNSYACYSWQTNRFVPVSAAPNKTCSGAWSGDFLNYLTMSRMDALRRVLYGGWRHVDTNADTTLQGAFFPQDAHSWGKEYQSVARDGYDISNYAPLSAPAQGTYHLFAVTTTTDTGAAFPDYTAPMFRVMQNSPYRVWNWLSIEGPVAGNSCFTSSNTRATCVVASTQAFPGHPNSRGEFDTLEANYAVAANLYGSDAINTINCNGNNCNPHDANQNEFMTIFQGEIRRNTGGTQRYQFRVNGDDAIDFRLTQTNGNQVAVAGCYGARGFGACNGNEMTAVVELSGNTTYRFKFRQEEGTGGEGYLLEFRTCNNSSLTNCNGAGAWTTVSGTAQSGLLMQNTTRSTYDLTPTSPSSGSRQDYLVRVQSCPGGAGNAALRDGICKAYGTAANPIYKPTGILHDYGETRKMFFGLITGSQRNNLEGGVLRSNIEDFNREIDPDTGVFRTNVEGIVRSIDRLRMIGGGYNNNVTDNTNSDTNWNWANAAHGVGGNCVSQGGRVVNNGECRMWGNPIAEMLYEGLRYFAGAAAATQRFSSTGGSTQGTAEDTRLGLPAPAWRDPYADTVVNGVTTHTAYPSCARPHQTIISDINPSYDGDLPGSAFAGAITTTNDTPATISAFNAANQGQAIWTTEFGAARNVFIGEVVGSTSDGAPTAKAAGSFGNIRGLSPEEPTKQGTYYSASVARFGRNTDVNAATGPQNVNTYSVALASPLPKIEFPVSGRTVTLLPFAKTVSGTFGGNAIKPTNTIVDFYVESFANFPAQIAAGDQDTNLNGGRPRAVFRINYEDVEQGNDHDMDMIVRYQVVANADSTVTVTLLSEYAAGSANQNAGYVISGTTQDGIYLEVRDSDSAQNTSVYELNTPAGVSAGGCVGATGTAPCNQGLGLSATRTFTPGVAGGGGTQLKDPLWYAAKYGSPTPTAWDANGDGDPDNYFLVTNPLNLRAQMSRAFDNIANYSIDSGSQSLSGARVGSSSFTLLPSFRRDRQGKDWSGNLVATAVNRDGTLATAELWNAQARLPAHGARNIRTVIQPGANANGVEFLGNNANLGGDDATRLARLGITGPLASLPNAYGAVYTAEAIVDYLRGDQSREAGRPGVGNTLRARTSVLGDIVNSEPIIASPRSDFGYDSYSAGMFDGYDDYLVAKQSRPTVVYVGANDGMLHAFNGNTVPCSGNPTVACAGSGAGDELFAFIPQESLRRMGELPLPDSLYEHRYYVDGQVTVTDAKQGGNWKTVLVGTMGGGGRSVFALDVSNPSGFGNGDVLWELNSSVDQDIGNVYGRPLLLPLENNRWGVLFGNGYGGNTSDPSLYIRDAFTGAQIAKLTANDGDPATTSANPLTNWICNATGLLCARTNHPFNGLGQITAIDRDGNGKADTVYGGDLQGNVWKFDLSNASAGAWNVALGGAPLVTAIASNGERQPVTGGMRVSAGPGAGVMVYFGTGRYFVEGDNEIPQAPDVQSLYAVFDNGTPIAIEDAGDKDAMLQRQWIQGLTTTMVDHDSNDATAEVAVTTRNISRNRVSYYGPNAKRGWYLDLVIDNADGDAAGDDLDPVGERFIATPRIQSGRVFFTTFSPTGDSCEPGGTNIVYALDLLSGSGALSNVTTLGANEPGCVGPECGAVEIQGSGAPITSTSVAAINPTKFIGDDAACEASGDCPTFEECQVVIYPGAFVLPRPCGRQSWRQLR
ncbi:pilus assembly protein [Luteimonas saliphila]|uniref:pilus assembly protein n=1 Tax=Luteimonas saliphila TaxID=2804919 RepID=UPI00192DF4CD|nr:PilC/PilY family type IV pilus protein [Luteimonas saliphila]